MGLWKLVFLEAPSVRWGRCHVCKRGLTIRTGSGLFTATALEMLPTINRFQPLEPRDPRIIPSQDSLVDMATMAAIASPLATTVVVGTPAAAARSSARPRMRRPSASAAALGRRPGRACRRQRENCCVWASVSLEPQLCKNSGDLKTVLAMCIKALAWMMPT